ncbi:MAG: hypothetical protein Q4P07_02185 [Ornithinimicrobium sp.]|uniref:hypothetical protein n=1 Tax=Ornithinimicrobium sp. TaxID=1977084 RepID=UPI0026E0E955|nr:hypothetical protein [Ornithinimicrobium sp.]MDO5738937.1 hypothetical protein [Ornithinimicrobium sp.]
MSAAAAGPSVLNFADGEAIADLATYVTRAKSLDSDAAIRLQAVGRVLAAWTAVVPGQGLTQAGLVLALRTMPLAEEHDLDVTVPLAALSDRFARRAATHDAGTTIPVPPATVQPIWTAVTPPRGGWEDYGRVSSVVLLGAAEAGIEEIAKGAPEGSGANAVARLRNLVWSRAVAGGATAGAGLAAKVLGFARPGDGLTATVSASGSWTRVTLPAGYILSR